MGSEMCIRDSVEVHGRKARAMTFGRSGGRSGMSEQKVKGPASYFPSIEAKYGEPIAHWKQVIRSTPGYGDGVTHMQLVGVLKVQHGLGHGHANALVAHTLAEDKG